MQAGRKSCWRQLQASFFRLLCLIPTGFPVRSVDMQRATDNITIRQGDTAIIRCYVDDKVSKVAWLNRSNIIFAGQDKWSLDPRVDLVTKGQLEYSLRIQKVDVYDEGSYTCSIQTKQQPKTSQVYLIVQVPANIYKVSEDITVNEGSNVTLSCLASGRPDPTITWRLLNPSESVSPTQFESVLGTAERDNDVWQPVVSLLHAFACLGGNATLLSYCEALKYLLGPQMFMRHKLLVAKGRILEVLGGGRLGEWRHPIKLDEGGNGASGRARNPLLHASQTTKIEVRQ
ncbi:limbic system-associated membrane protein-like, partial [Seriola dumerili]|uniref:limbic system-associated membrane protein-like n=1 Tax=Seriola dumerili TaxID=41447 RepID=UPI000BBF1F14